MKASRSWAGDGISPLISLRADLAGRAPARDDDDALIVAALLRHAASRPGTRESRRSLAVARRVARRLVTAEELRHGPGFDEPHGRMPFKLLRTAADHAMRVQGRIALATGMLDSLSALIPAASAEGGRLLAQRAATAWYAGDNELSAERYRRLARLGRKIGEPELVARGAHGIAAVRMSTGNVPAAERLMKRAIRLAGTAFPRVASQSTLKLAIFQATRGEFDSAVTLAWRAYQLARNCEPDRRVVMGNLAQLLLDAGHPEASRAAAKHVLRRTLVHTHRIGVLGTYARAAAALGDVETVDWCASQLRELATPAASPQPVADALLECSYALDDVGRRALGTRMRRQAQEIAERYGYHDVAYLAETGTRRGRPVMLRRPTQATQAIATEVRALDSGSVPSMKVHAG